MHVQTLEILRCPFCGTRFSVVENEALSRDGDRIESGVLGCECCAFPIVAGIPVMMADETTGLAMHAMEAGRRDEGLSILLGLDEARGAAFGALQARGQAATYRDAIALLSPDAEGTYFVYRFSDPTYLLAQSLLQAIGQNPWVLGSRVIDLCGGSGHLTRVLMDLRASRQPVAPAGHTVIADIHFWKLWLASRFTSPGCEPVCCDANSPLPFARQTFSMAVLSDAFPYIWHKRQLADEMMRLTVPGGTLVLPHLHSARGENFSAGMTLTPAAYQDLFDERQPRLFSDATLLNGMVDRATVDLSRHVSAAALDGESSLTLVAGGRDDLFRTYDIADPTAVSGELKVNPLYRVEKHGVQSVLTLTFPTPEYEEEFGECKRYLPETVTIAADLTGPINAERLRSSLGTGPDADYAELRRRRILIDAPRQDR